MYIYRCRVLGIVPCCCQKQWLDWFTKFFTRGNAIKKTREGVDGKRSGGGKCFLTGSHLPQHASTIDAPILPTSEGMPLSASKNMFQLFGDVHMTRSLSCISSIRYVAARRVL